MSLDDSSQVGRCCVVVRSPSRGARDLSRGTAPDTLKTRDENIPRKEKWLTRRVPAFLIALADAGGRRAPLERPARVDCAPYYLLYTTVVSEYKYCQ